jgi:hypothetical protein
MTCASNVPNSRLANEKVAGSCVQRTNLILRFLNQPGLGWFLVSERFKNN